LPVATSHLKDSKIGTLTDKTYYITEGAHTISRPLIIPSDHKIDIAPGAEINFNGNGKILCYGQFTAIGSAQNPIKFYSDGQTKGGILISGSDHRSRFKNCQFVGLSNFEENNIKTTAALGIFKSNAELSDCIFNEIKAKECFVSNYSIVEINNSQFNSCQGSGIVSNYSSLKLNGVTLSEIGQNGVVIKAGSLNGVNVNIKKVLGTAIDIK